MQNIKNKLELSIYGYDANEFMPIRYDNALVNRNEFILYKVKRLVRKLVIHNIV